MPILPKLVDLVLYSNAWIALAALAMCAQSQLLLFGHLRWDPLWGLVFFGTLALYAVHRLVGLSRVEAWDDESRFAVIGRYRRPFRLIAVVAAGLAAWFLWACGPRIWLAVSPAVLLSVAYVTPLPGGKRLRDLPYIKIFLIAGVWSYVTVGLPAVRRDWLFTAPALLMLVERALFIFALTLPFDIRDLRVDARADVRTLAARLGPPGSRRLAIGCLLAMLVPVYGNWRLDAYPTEVGLALLGSGLLTAGLVQLARPQRHDHFYTGLIDGLMLVQFALVWLAW